MKKRVVRIQSSGNQIPLPSPLPFAPPPSAPSTNFASKHRGIMSSLLSSSGHRSYDRIFDLIRALVVLANLYIKIYLNFEPIFIRFRRMCRKFSIDSVYITSKREYGIKEAGPDQMCV